MICAAAFPILRRRHVKILVKGPGKVFGIVVAHPIGDLILFAADIL
jgi:hypothetical protein